MSRTARGVLEVEIRGTNSPYQSDTMEGNADVNVLEDTIHGRTWEQFDNFTFYAEDDQDTGFDVSIQSVDVENTDYSGVGEESTLTISSGVDGADAHVDGPLGLIRYVVENVGTAPTEGTLKIIAVAHGRD